jgi:inward rectifier potassium channel
MTRKLRRRYVNMGNRRAIRIGGPGAAHDLYNWTMEMAWPAFVALAATVFIVINIGFGLIYQAMPGAVLNAAPGSFLDAFFFSVETMATVGYGNMAPATHSGHSVALVEIMVGLFFTATFTGLIFARFARPRESLIFSDVAVICDYEGKRALMVRVALKHTRPLAAATAQVAVLARKEMSKGRSIAGFVDLPLVRPAVAMINMSWTLIHIIDGDSPLVAALASDEPLALIVTVSGQDTLLARQVFGGTSYDRSAVLPDHNFVDVMSNRDGTIHMDMTRLHDVARAAP